MAIPWDDQTINRRFRRNLSFNQGDDLTALKAKIAQLPDTNPETVTINMRLQISSTEDCFKAVFAALPDSVPVNSTILVDMTINKADPYTP